MNTDPDAIKVLCFGDSNTWGQKPDKSGRYPANVRWPGKLQELLGSSYYVIEEGLGSRTTDIEYARKPGRNGKTYLQPCLESHSPIDIVVIMLGTNDLKIEFNRSPEEIGEALGGLVEMTRSVAKNKDGQQPDVLLVSPILIDSTAPHFKELYTGYYDDRSTSKSKELGQILTNVAQTKACHFLDAATVAQPGDDGIHFDEPSHPALAEAIAKEIKKLKE